LVKKPKAKPVEEKPVKGKRKSSEPIPEVFKKKSNAGTVLDCSNVKSKKGMAKGKRD